MGWWLIVTGALLFLTGIFIKTREYEDYGDYKDFQKLTTNTRYIRKDSDVDQNNYQSDSSYNKGHYADRVVKDARKKEKRLEEINNNLDQIIKEISKKEEKIKNSLEEINLKNQDQDLPDNFKKLLKRSEENIREKKLSDKDRKILDFAEKGLDKEEIADRLNIGIRETGLILRMHKRGAVDD